MGLGARARKSSMIVENLYGIGSAGTPMCTTMLSHNTKTANRRWQQFKKPKKQRGK